ncbi:HSP20-like chaperone [Spinellus fusiger]|nr:HSP20-like chaperone [Spinellus fusiger]
MPKCTHKGCGKEFSEKENLENSCQFHPGAPVFHEGLKGWSCCQKRVIDFDEFMTMAGCSYGQHSTEQEKVDATEPTATSVTASQVTEAGVEVYGQPVCPPPPSVKAPAVKTPSETVIEVEAEDDETLAVPEGKVCLRKCCNATYKGDAVSRGEGAEAVCHYHPGAPIFHEGSKGWSCCSRKVLDFDAFLMIKGCKQGKHLFLGNSKTGEELVECRTDWYQTQTHVMLSIFAKNKEDTKVIFHENTVAIDIKMKENKRYKKTMALFHTILPEQSKFTVLGTKLELTMKKTDGMSWASLEPNADVKTWTTFGVSGGGGTVGAKEMQYCNDSPLHLSNRN